MCSLVYGHTGASPQGAAADRAGRGQDKETVLRRGAHCA